MSNNVGFLVRNYWSEFGSSDALYSWFSTICYRLEDSKWGSRFPVVMKDLYYDEEYGVPYEKVEQFREELETIEQEFSNLTPKDAIWSFEDNILEVPPNMPNINYSAKSLVDFYVNNRGSNIFKILFEMIEEMKYYKVNLRIVTEKNLITTPKIMGDPSKYGYD